MEEEAKIREAGSLLTLDSLESFAVKIMVWLPNYLLQIVGQSSILHVVWPLSIYSPFPTCLCLSLQMKKLRLSKEILRFTLISGSVCVFIYF